jgi:hypothetical protein
MSSWIQKELLKQSGLNKLNRNSDPNAYICWLFQENTNYYVTDLDTKIFARFDQRLMIKIKNKQNQINQNTAMNSTPHNNNNNKQTQITNSNSIANTNAGSKTSQTLKIMKIYLKLYSYSSMMNFQSKTKVFFC